MGRHDTMLRLPRRLSSLLVAVLLASACDDAPGTPPAPEPPPVVDPCAGLAPLTLTATPARVHVAGVALLAATGGSGHYRFRVESGGSSGQVSGDRFVAGATPATDTLVVEDARCPGDARAQVTVVTGFAVGPARATVRPGTSFQVDVRGVLGEPTFTLVRNDSGGTVADGRYTAGAGQGVDLVQVRDGLTGEEAILHYEVRAGVALRGDPALLAVPAGSSVPLAVRDGSDRVQWTKLEGPGAVEGTRFVAEPGARGVAVLEARDAFTGDTARVSVRVLEELTRPVQPHGRNTDSAHVVTADFDGDGVQDVAVGQRESDLTRPLGGAVFIFKGSASGLPTQPTWVLTGDSDTAQFGDVLAAGDLDGDGRAELAVSAPGADVTIGDSGAVYLYRFEAGGPVLLRQPLTGLGRGSFGAGLTIADMDMDGDLDLVVGSPLGDLAPTSTLSRRGVVDIFLLGRGQAVPDLPAIRLGGSDVGLTGALEARSNTDFGRTVLAADLNMDGRTDLVALSKVTRWRADGTSAGVVAQAVAVHFARSEGARFRASPDVYVLPSNAADSNEGTWRLGVVPAEGTRPPLLLVVSDRANSPDLRQSGGVQSGSDSGGALLFDLSNFLPTGEPPATPAQVQRESAFARLYGDANGIVAGRSWAVLDVDGTPGPELVLGAPYASPPPATGSGTVSLGGKLLVYPLTTLTRGSVLNKPLSFIGGRAKADVLGAGLAVWSLPGGRPGLVAFAGRASTEAGAFTGRVDAWLKAGASLAEWERMSAPVPARPAVERFGEAVLLARGPGGGLVAVVGAAGFSGPGASGDGNDLSAGRTYVYAAATGGPAAQVVEGRNSPLFHGRNVGADVAFTDFNGDGRPDLVLGAPAFTVAGTSSQANELTPHYAQVRAECVLASNVSVGAVLVSLGQADGTFKPAYRLWASDTLSGCTPSSSSDTRCQRRQVGRGVVGGFDFNGDGKQDLGALRNNGFELYLGRAPDDATLDKLTMGCDPLYTSPSYVSQPVPSNFTPQQTSAPAAVGDLDQDGCDEVAWRYADSTRSGVVVLFGYDTAGARCNGRTQPAWVRLAADAEVGMSFWGLGVATERVGRFLDDGRELLALSATAVPFEGVAQPVVLLFDVAEIAAKRPTSGEALVAAVGAGLTPQMLVNRSRAVNFGRALAGGVDLTRDGVPDLVVGATGASVASDGGGAVFVYAGGKAAKGALTPLLTVVGDVAERGAFGQELSLAPGLPGPPATPPMLLIGAPTSYRTGTQNGTAFLLPLPLEF
jgi:hypothetical protein